MDQINDQLDVISERLIALAGDLCPNGLFLFCAILGFRDVH